MEKGFYINEGITFYPNCEHEDNLMATLVMATLQFCRIARLQEMEFEDLPRKIWYSLKEIDTENSWIQYIQLDGKTYVSITVVETEVVPKKGKEGFLIKGIIRRAMVNVATQKVGQWYDKVTVVITPTPKGVRYMSFQDGKPFFGFSNILRACQSTNMNRQDQQMLYNRIFRALNGEVSVLDIYPELKYFNNQSIYNNYDQCNEYCDHDDHMNVYDLLDKICLMHPFLTKSLGTHSGAKAILNSIYSPTGEKRIQKSAFGGVGEIRNRNDLLSAMLWCRALRLLDPQTFSNVSQTLPLFSCLSMWDSSMSDLIRVSDQISNYFRYFGTGEKAVQIMVTSITENPTRCSMNISDAMMMFKQIRSRVVRRAIVDHFRRNNMTIEQLHEHITVEFQKIKTENRKISVKELSEFAGRVSDEIVCVAPKQTHDLIRWGSEYNICIGSYAEKVLAGNTFCMGFQKPDGTFWGFAEVSREMQLKQLLGKHNQPLPSEQRHKIEKYLKTKGVTIPKRYLGSE